MSIPNSAPVVVEQAFSGPQLASLRAALAEARTLMDQERRRANSIGFEALARMGRQPLVIGAMSAFINSRAHGYAMEQFPDGYSFLLRNCSFRYHDPALTKSHLDLHFDANFLGLGGKAVNVWVPLDDLTDGVPGLTFLNAEADPIVLYRAWRANREAIVSARAPGPAAVDIFFDRSDVRAAYGELGDAVFQTPRIKAGGFIAFHQLVAHGTELVEQSPKPRGSIEFRIAAPDALPDVYRDRSASLAIVTTDADGRRGVDLVLTKELRDAAPAANDRG